MKLWQYRLLAAIVGFGLLDGSSTFAETGPRLSGDRKTSAAQATGTVLTRSASYQLNNSESSPFREETTEPPMPPIFGAVATDQESDDEPVATTTDDDPMPVPLPGEVPAGEAIDPAYPGVPNDATYPMSGAAGGAGAGGGSYLAGNGNGNWGYANSGCGCGSCSGLGCPPRCGGITFGGWLDQGVTANGRYPVDRFNGPVTFNDRDGEYQMNQLWLYAEKETNTGGYGWDVGGRVDFMYGTDWRFTSSYGDRKSVV